MANTPFEYVRKFETVTTCLQNCWIVVRVDGRCFHRFSTEHCYEKPNDKRGLTLLTKCAKNIMGQFGEIVCAYGQSDEYRQSEPSFARLTCSSFVFRRDSRLYQRRTDLITSLMSSTFVFYWKDHFPDTPLKYPPSFDGRCIVYPDIKSIRDYLSWRQADCHINNLYNTCFWALVNEGKRTPNQAEIELRGTVSSDKNELLFSQFQTNYNNVDPLYRKGTFLVRFRQLEAVTDQPYMPCSIESSKCHGEGIVELFTDIIGDEFWSSSPHILI